MQQVEEISELLTSYCKEAWRKSGKLETRVCLSSSELQLSLASYWIARDKTGSTVATVNHRLCHARGSVRNLRSATVEYRSARCQPHPHLQHQPHRCRTVEYRSARCQPHPRLQHQPHRCRHRYHSSHHVQINIVNHMVLPHVYDRDETCVARGCILVKTML